MATRRSAAATRSSASEPIVVPDSSQETNSSFSCSSSHKEDTQDTDADFDSQLDIEFPVDSQGPAIGEELEELIDHPNHADVDMEIHERIQQATAAQHSDAPSAAPSSAPAAGGPRRASDAGTSQYERTPTPEAPEVPDAIPAQEITIPTEHWRSSNPLHPTINFSEISECAMPTAQALPPNTALYELNHQFNPTIFDQVKDLRGIIRKRWQKLGGTSNLKVLAQPVTGRVRQVHVVFPSVEDFSYANQLAFYWKGKSYHATAYGPALGPRYSVISVQVPPTADPEEAADEFLRQTDHRVEVVRLWSIASAPENMPEWADFTGHLVAVVHIKSDTDNNDDPLPPLFRRVLMAWFRWEGKDYETFFLGRPAWCRLCRGRATEFTFHLLEDCHNTSCANCNEKHKTQDCPLAVDDSQAAAASTPAEDSTPEPSAASASTSTASPAPTTSLRTPPAGAGLPPRPTTPRTPSRLASINTPGRTPGASTSTSPDQSSSPLMARLSDPPVFTSNPKDKGKGKQLSMVNYVRPRPPLTPTSDSSAPKRSAPSTTASVAPAKPPKARKT
ncbi:hypothetical protein CF326_g3165 [Tilletia indica]|nr:hypothetical protein CF326_g3165 [Tilletia indica]